MKGTVLVTGSSRGIGKGIALRLAQDGYDMVLHCRRNIDEAESVASQVRDLGRSARVLQFDIANRDQTREVLEQDTERSVAIMALSAMPVWPGIMPFQRFPGRSGMRLSGQTLMVFIMSFIR